MSDRFPWDDERLDSAFRARASAARIPPDLAAEVVTGLRAGGRTTGRMIRFKPIAAAIAVVVLIGVVAAVGSLPGPAPDGPSPSTHGTEPSSDGAPTTGASGDPATVLGLPVLTVSEFRARSIGEPNATEVAVRGWIARSDVDLDLDCNQRLDHPLVPGCLDSSGFLFERRQQIHGSSRPTGPHVQPVIGPDANLDAVIPVSTPIEVIAIGHLDDHRWTTCPETLREACRRQFVVDRLVSAEGPVQPRPAEPWAYVTDPLFDHGAAIKAIEAKVGDLEIVVSVGVLDGGAIWLVEPSAQDLDEAQIAEPVWLIRGMVSGQSEPGVARTFLVSAASIRAGQPVAFEVTGAGPEPLPPAVGTTPVPTTTPGPPASDDGIVWTESTLQLSSVEGSYLSQAVRHGDRFYAVGDLPQDRRGLLASDDGIRWEPTDGPRTTRDLARLVVVGDRLVALGWEFTEEDALIDAWWTEDGSHWTEMPVPDDSAVYPWELGTVGDRLLAASASRLYRLEANSWEPVGDVRAFPAENGFAEGPSGTILVTLEDDPRWVTTLAISSDGKTWEPTELPGEGRDILINAVAANDARYVGVGRTGTDREPHATGWYSDDGRTWQSVDLPVTEGRRAAAVHQVVAAGRGFIASGLVEEELGPRPILWWSDDGASWEELGGSVARDDRLAGIVAFEARVILVWQSTAWSGIFR